MKKKEQKYQKHRFALTLLVSAVMFCILLLTGLLTALFGYILISSGAISLNGDTMVTPFQIIVQLLVISLILGVVITVAVSRFPLKPVNRIISQMNRLASGDYKARLSFGKPLGHHPAAVEIATSFNRMAEELDKTEMLRSDFINNFSHEFKTPIVSIAGFAKLLKRGNLTEEQRAEYIDIIEEESLRLSAMATNVLNMTKVENQIILTGVTEFNLSEQIRNCILLLERKWTKKQLEFSIDFDEYTISGNEELLNHVWINLIDNAIKFSPAGEKIAVDITEQGDFLSVSVLNRGKALSPEQQQRIFQKFYQADESHSSEGNGIGLAVVKGVVELHKGNVTVSSENNTTVFTVEIPKRERDGMIE